MSPREMFDRYVVPACRDALAEPGALHRAVSALVHIDALAEEVWLATGRPHGSPSKYREELRRKCPELGYAWDVHDIHKHGMLTRRAPVLPNGRRPTIVEVGGAFADDAFSDAFQIGGPEVVLRLADGALIVARSVIEKSTCWWEAELKKVGL